MPEHDRPPEAESPAADVPREVDDEPDEATDPPQPEDARSEGEPPLPRPRRPGWFKI